MHIGQQREWKKMMNHILQKYYTEWKKKIRYTYTTVLIRRSAKTKQKSMYFKIVPTVEVGNKKKDSRTSPFFSFLDNFRKWLDLSIFTWRCNHRDPSAVFLVPFQDILFHELAGSYTLTAIYALYNSEHSIYYCSVYLERLTLQHRYHNNYVIAEELLYFLCGFLLHYSQNL